MIHAFRLVDQTENELIFGIDNLENNATLAKLKQGITKICPYKQVVPYYKNSKFAFISLDAFKYFLFHLCKFEYEDIIELERLGFKVVNETLGVYSKGLSKLICTYFDDEIVELKEESLSNLFASVDSINYKMIEQPIINKEDIKDCKDWFYKNVKFIK